jgi:hypothetical protein
MPSDDKAAAMSAEAPVTGIGRLFQITCLSAGIFALTVVVGFLLPYRPPPEWLVNAGVASMLGGLIAWASCAVAVVVSLFRKA